ncbi:nuclear transport factor 2 family protein [Lacibacter sp.]|uniref:nuclear transport factor 2 family protein n=1 Tax=Lacibacter sp. TaxID=1915409 RepID=UPI002B4AC560|nr:nuclear transport factor 2 family protein [Lacibacter sp.]HLP36889.1 nuclear transport factor 2 family protein [Lacibacter sp.]
MQKINLLLVLLLLSSITLAQTTSSEQVIVQQTIVKLFDALSNRDSVSLKAWSTADITLYEYGELWNIDTLIHKAIKLNTAKEFVRTNTFEFIHTTVDNKMALVNYLLQSVIMRDGKQATVQWLETVVLIKERNQWKVKHLHSTLIKRS